MMTNELGSDASISQHTGAEAARQREARANAAISELLTALLSSHSIERTTALVLEKTQALTDSALGYAGYIDPATGYLVTPTLTGEAWDACDLEQKDIVFTQFAGLWGWVLKHGQSLLTNAPDQDERASGTPPGHPVIQRFLSAPALLNGRVVGQLALANSDRDYDEHDLAVVEQLAALFALAIDKAWLFDENRRQREQLEWRVAERTLDLERSQARFKSVFQQSPVAIELYDVDGRLIDANLACLNLFGVDSVAAIQGFQLFADPNIPAEAKEQLQAGQPVRFESEFDFDLVRQLGLYVTRKQGRCVIDCVITPWLSERESLNGFLVHVRDVTERQQVIQALERRNRELTVLYAVHRAASQSLDLDEMLRAILTVLQDPLGFEKAGVLLLEPDSDIIKLRIQLGLSQEDAQRLSTVRVGEGMAGRAALERRPVVMAIDEYPDPQRMVGLRQDAIQSIASIPLLAGGDLVGVLNLATARSGAFGQDELALLSAIGQQLGQAVRNVRLYARLQQELAERQRIETALRQSENNLSALINNNDQRIWSVDRSYRLLVFNAEFARALEEVLGKPLQVGDSALDASLSPEVREYWRSAYDRALAGEAFRIEDKSTILPNDAYIEYSFSPIRDMDGQVTGAACSFRYITERKLAEIALQESEARFRTLFEQAATGMASIDSMGRYLRVNQCFCRFLGYSESELLAMNFQDVTHPDDLEPNLTLFQQMLNNEIATYSIEKRYVRKDGSLVWATLTAAGLRDADGRIVYFISSIQDISQRKQIEEELWMARIVAEQRRQAAEDASRVKSAFLASMSHELRTPLNSILGFSQLVARDPSVGEDARASLEVIRRNGEHLMALINDLLELSRIESGRADLVIVAFDLHLLLHDVVDMLHLRAVEKALNLQVQIAPQTPRQVTGDQRKLRQVLINLLGNAVKFTAAGYVRLRVEIVEPQHDPARAMVTFTVEDSGTGIAPADLATIFDAFIQTEAGRRLGEGTGLGLAISREYVDLMGGMLQVRSTVGRGSVFWFSLPLQVVDGFGQSVQADWVERRAEAASTLSVLHLDGLPADWLEQVRVAAIRADGKSLNRLIEQIAHDHPAAAEALVCHMNEFAYEVILAAVDQALTGSTQ